MKLTNGTVADVREKVTAVRRLHQTGLIDLWRPRRIKRMIALNNSYGPQAAMISAGAADRPDRPALTDEHGVLTYRELDEQSNALAHGLLGQGLRGGEVIGVLARDHRGLVLAMVAAGKAGLRLAMLNTGFAKPQLTEVAVREQVRAILFDSEFAGLVDALPETMPRILTWVDAQYPLPPGAPTIDMLISANSTGPLPPPSRPAGFIILTSGTTGLPKGAPRTKVSPFATALVVDRVPFPRGGVVMIATPVFHTTGMGTWTIASALGAEIVLRRRFDAQATLAAIERHAVEMLVAVPTQLSRILALGPDVIARYDTSTLRTVFVGGAPLPPDLATRWQDAFGDVLYNGYGSTEVAITAVAQPHELRRAPGTVGRAPVTARIALYDSDDRRITAANVSGRIFARTVAPFEGYTDGKSKQIIDGYMSTGDMGHFDADGLLFIDGRDDDMVVCGGENVYPLEVENLLAGRADIADVAVIGVDDTDFGQRLRAFVVAATDGKPDAQEIKEYVKDNLARYKAPRDVVFLDEIPRNPTGKIVRKALTEYVVDGPVGR
ncbi:acyl-CoA synthetase [Nocardia fluminea]|uniref:Fatty-acyl-CoA synthase n=1 Tax=Nocardia fluminea TaxID=134984 RepID=A0A2N3VKY8_9NOCA|nr:acyl-CoA synthetase [Nocardia fluminea]PKV82274.1 fatty-acyl-CoA synthase [Nocardia fluminea]